VPPDGDENKFRFTAQKNYIDFAGEVGITLDWPSFSIVLMLQQMARYSWARAWNKELHSFRVLLPDVRPSIRAIPQQQSSTGHAKDGRARGN
jgi:hypothetical protein